MATRIDAVLPGIRRRREEIEKSRTLPADLVEELRRTGVFSLGIPRAIGGREASPVELMQVIEKVASADGSAGWCTMIGAANNVSSGYMNEAGAKEVFADVSEPCVGIAAPAAAAAPVPGGFRVSGRWSFASGVAHSKWGWFGCMVMENGSPRLTPHGPEIVHLCIPIAELTIHDTWHVSGLCGTGSNDVSANDVFVPEHRAFALLDPTGHRAEPLYQFPPLTLFVVQVACVALGVTRSALDEVLGVAHTKVPTMYADVLAERAAAQMEIPKAEAALGGARAFLHEIVAEMWDLVLRGRPTTDRQRALARAAATQAAETAVAVTRTANLLAGGSSIYSTSTLQRHGRDADAIAHHFTVAPHTWEQAGRLLLGCNPLVPAV